jgi:cell division protein FtsQ
MNSNAITHHQGQFTLPLTGRRPVVVMLGIVLIVVVAALLRSGWLTPSLVRIDSVQVFGELGWVNRENLDKAVKPYLDSNFFSADLYAIKQAVESLPWVASASVRRSWPNQLQIVIQEQQPVARWRDRYLINDKGQLFHPGTIPDELARHLVRLEGPVNTYQYLFDRYRELQPLFATGERDSNKEEPAGGLAISKVSLDERRALGIELSNGIQIKFGRVSASVDMYNAAARFLSVYENSLKQQAGDIGVVDLRYTNGFAVQWKKSADGRRTG